jgi:hypothetical protein
MVKLTTLVIVYDKLAQPSPSAEFKRDIDLLAITP